MPKRYHNVSCLTPSKRCRVEAGFTGAELAGQLHRFSRLLPTAIPFHSRYAGVVDHRGLVEPVVYLLTRLGDNLGIVVRAEIPNS